jgi:hypothetical protein
MAKLNQVRPSLPQMFLGGRLRTLQYDMNAFSELDKRYGSVQEAMAQMQKGRMADIKIILWAGLIHDEVEFDEDTGEPAKYNITPYQVGSWVQPDQMAEVSEKMALAMGGSVPETDSAKNSRGPSSGLIGATEGMAQVVLTPEEEAAQALEAKEAKNG